MEYTSGGGASWRQALRRAASALHFTRSRRSGWSIGVPLIGLAAGFLFTVSANTAQGTVLREDRRVELAQLIDAKQTEVDRLAGEAKALQAQVDGTTNELAVGDGPIKQERERSAPWQEAAGLTEMRGPGLTVRLNDAPIPVPRPDNSRLDDYVIHQQDVQAVVNALWAGGAEAMTIMDVRVISTSAVRCVGNTLLLHGRRYSPEFVIRAIGDPGRMRSTLDASPSVAGFRDAVRNFGLGYTVTTESSITAPPYTGPTDLRYAEVPS
ncbi:DUF881 domain-containing protein [Allorhizocola rhizosphaerae]|uniref:DUF881 domain-containing protein n=1 Tax=Allorhizocola rhizosphaerae TaxID=1872709 RepID=UPI000E3DF608|nr:DUF881 domain-containing protein [Allorhizocola rhizosphaerae]